MSTVNMQAVAEQAGVSRTTVSRALCTPERVRPATLARIQAIMERLGYVYHSAAADLPRKKTSIIGLVIPSLRTPIFADTILAVQNAADELGMTVMLGCSHYDPVREEHLLHQYRSRRLAGLILIGHTPGREAQIQDLQAAGIPCVVIWTTPDHPSLSQVGFDNRQSVEEMIDYLVGLGHTRIAIVTGPLGAGRRVQDRLEGYKNALERHGLAFDRALVGAGEPEISVGEEEMRRLMSLKNPPTAVFTASDMLAVGALSAARKLGLSVPGDVSVAGFDDIEFAAHTNPPLTTIAVPSREMAWMATRFLRDLINGREPEGAKTCRLSTRLVIRESCGPPPSTARRQDPTDNA